MSASVDIPAEPSPPSSGTDRLKASAKSPSAKDGAKEVHFAPRPPSSPRKRSSAKHRSRSSEKRPSKKWLMEHPGYRGARPSRPALKVHVDDEEKAQPLHVSPPPTPKASPKLTPKTPPPKVPHNTPAASPRSPASPTPSNGGRKRLSDNKKDARSFLVSLMSGIYTVVIFLVALSIEASTLFAEHGERGLIRVFRESFYIYLFGVSLFFLIFFMLLRSSNRIMVWMYRVLGKEMPDDGRGFGASNSATVSAGSMYLRLGCIIFGIIGVLYYGIDIYAVIREAKDHALAHRAADHRGPASGPSLAESHHEEAGHSRPHRSVSANGSSEPNVGSKEANPVGLLILSSTLGGIFMFVQMVFIFQNSKMVIHRFKHIGRASTMHLVATNLCMMIRFLVAEEFHLLEAVNKAGHGHSSAVRDAVAEFVPIMFTCQVEYSLICAAVMYLLWKNIGVVKPPRTSQRRKGGSLRIDCTSSYKGLLAGLVVLVLTFVVLIINLISISEVDALTEAVSYSSHYYFCTLYTGMIGLLLGAFYQMRHFMFMKYDAEQGVMLLDDLLLFVGMVGEIMVTVLYTGYIVLVETSFQVLQIYNCFSRCAQVLLQTAFILVSQRLVAHTKALQASKPARNLISFLIMANVSLFFTKMLFTDRAGLGTRQHLKSEKEKKWIVMISTTIPLCVFYRFHSSVCLAEIWKHSYSYKSPWIKVKTLLLGALKRPHPH